MTGRRLLSLSLGLAAFVVHAKTVAVPALPAFATPDTEVSTNVPFNAQRLDVRSLDVRLDFAGTASNCVQMAFGRDDDGDGTLSADETALLAGWRRGRLFAEDARAGMRLFADVAEGTDSRRRLCLHVGTAPDGTPLPVAVSNGTGVCFAELASAEFAAGDWNLVRVTRRGVDAADESCEVVCRHPSLHVILK